MKRRIVITAALLAALAAPLALGGTAPITPGATASVATGGTASAASPPQSTFLATAGLESYNTVQTASDGDLWPSCWSDDDKLYTAAGDGKGFDLGTATASDVVVNRVSGMPPNLTGAALAKAGQVGPIWNGNGQYNRKPTGMVCVDGDLYLAVQDLRDPDAGDLAFNDAPNATIVKSTDHGATWTWDTAAPMFSGHTFTTIMFLDYGKNNANAIDSYVYAYALDGNWRDSYSNTVPDPVDVYLARVPKTQIQNRSAWQFFSGSDAGGNPTWSSNIGQKTAVLHDDRRVYQNLYSTQVSNVTILGQGGVVYNKPLGRYIYTSWSEYTFEFYEAPSPWGPWRPFVTKDHGGFPWSTTKAGGYATTIPSKFISDDGKSMWVQSNVCGCGGSGFWDFYKFGLRKLRIEPYTASTADNPRSDTANLAVTGANATPIERVAHFGNTAYLRDGNRTQNEDDWNDENKSSSWWGHTWSRNYTMNKVVYTTGNMFSDGGWFSGGPKVQVRQNFQWVDVAGLSAGPHYPGSSAAGTNKTYTFTFDPIAGDGVRIIGTPGGARTFTSIAELEVYYGATVRDQGFERQTADTVSAPWAAGGDAGSGIDRGAGSAHSGANNAWIRTSDTAWRDLKQPIDVVPNTDYRLTGWVRGSANVTGGWFGVRSGTGPAPHAEVNFGSLPSYTKLTVDFSSGSNTQMTVFGGFWGAGADSWIQLDDITIARR